MSTIVSLLRTLFVNKIMSGCINVLSLIHFVFFFGLGYVLVCAPLSKAPGAHDGMGLLLVLIVNFMVSIFVTAIVVGFELSLIRGLLPDWKPEVDILVDALSSQSDS